MHMLFELVGIRDTLYVNIIYEL